MFEVAMMKETLNAPLTQLIIRMFSADSTTWLAVAKSATEVQLEQGSSQPVEGEHNDPPTPPKGKRHLS